MTVELTAQEANERLQSDSLDADVRRELATELPGRLQSRQAGVKELAQRLARDPLPGIRSEVVAHLDAILKVDRGAGDQVIRCLGSSRHEITRRALLARLPGIADVLPEVSRGYWTSLSTQFPEVAAQVAPAQHIVSWPVVPPSPTL